MKLLLDQNLSPRLVHELRSSFPGSAHVRDFGLQSASDQQIWDHAAKEGFTVASKDADFHQMSFLLGPPPKVIWVRLGNASTGEIMNVFVEHKRRIEEFQADKDAALLVLP